MAATATATAPKASETAAKPEPEYIRKQKERLAEIKQKEAEGAWKSQGLSTEKIRLLYCLAAAGGVGCTVYVIMDYRNRANPTEQLKFLAEKELEEGVVKLPSGLLYKVLTKGEGRHHPKENASCSCHYQGTLLDGTEFDSSYKRGAPTSFAPNQVIKGWTEAMQLMVEGDKFEMYIPASLAYGTSGNGKIPGGSTLIFQMELLKINGAKVPALK